MAQGLVEDGYTHIQFNMSYYQWVIYYEPPPHPWIVKTTLLDLLVFIDNYCEFIYDEHGQIIVRLNTLQQY